MEQQESQESVKSISQENRNKQYNNNKRYNNSRPNNQNADKSAAPTNANANAANKNKNASKGRRRQGLPIDENLKAFVELNQESHRQRLNPHYKLDLNSRDKVRITPLGGLGEIGGNITVFETQNEAILVDVGMSFPDEDMHGVDILVPDFAYIREIKDKIKAVIITHAHEDHIGAMPYLYKEMQFPIYGSPLPLAMIASKFDEHHIREFKQYFNPIEKRKIYKIGEDFEIDRKSVV